MKLTYAYVVDESVVQLFADGKARDRQELLRIFQALVGRQPRDLLLDFSETHGKNVNEGPGICQCTTHRRQV